MSNRVSTTSVAISEMPKLPVVNPLFEIPGIIGGGNFTATVKSINALNTKATIGLPLVENIAPQDMPVSIPQKAELDKKLNIGDHIPVAQVDGLTPLLDAKMDKNAIIPQSQVGGLEARLVKIENDPIPVTRISNFDPAVQVIIDRQPKPVQSVIQGSHQW